MERSEKRVMRGEILFLKGSSDSLTSNNRRLRNIKLSVFLLGIILLPACAIKTTSTSLVPGKELSRQTVGTKTTTDRTELTVVNPYTVNVKKVHCSVEQFNIEYQGVTENKTETRQLNCSDAYIEYLIQNVTTLGVPFLYDSFTGFYIFRDKCIKLPPETMVSTSESREIIKREIEDSKHATCKETPVAGAVVKADLNSNIIDLVTDDYGNGTLPQRTLAQLEQSKSSSPIKYSYGDYALEAVYVPKPKPEPNRIMRADLNNITESEASDIEEESDSMAILEQEDTMATKSNPASKTAEADQSINKMIRKDLNAASGTKPDKQPANDTQMMAKLNEELAMQKGAPKSTPVVEPDLQANKISRDMNSVSAAKQDETDTMAKRNSSSDSAKAKPETELAALNAVSSGLTIAGMDNASSVQPSKAEETKPRLIVYFDTNRTTVKKEFLKKLKELARELKENPALYTSIEGHTDSAGGAEVNMKMSLKRAEAVKSYLVKTLGVPDKRIKIKGFGLTRPISSNDTENGRSINRRTEIIVITQSYI